MNALDPIWRVPLLMMLNSVEPKFHFSTIRFVRFAGDLFVFSYRRKPCYGRRYLIDGFPFHWSFLRFSSPVRRAYGHLATGKLKFQLPYVALKAYNNTKFTNLQVFLKTLNLLIFLFNSF